MAAATQLKDEARALVQRALRDHDDHYGFGLMSCAAYDTAWVSIVSKTVDGQKQYLFPECLQYLLDTQSEDGSWSIGRGAQIDGILNTAGPLMALKRHQAEPLQLQHDPQDIAARVERATASLREQLNEWDVSSTDHVGFEIIVPAMLNILQKEHSSLVFNFEGKKGLMKINQAKMARFRPEYLYGPRRMTALHSLESFIGMIDFDRVIHHKVFGSMLGSPSSTAAYLMNSSNWDDESETYLRHVIKYAAGQNNGGIPSAFPSTHFEGTWMLSTLFRVGFTPDDLACTELTKLTEILKTSFVREKGVLGFAPGFEPDVDDSAKTISCLNILGEHVSAQSLCDTFESENHFLTYAGEMNPSFTANSNALLALLHQPDVAPYATQIHKISKFLCDYWWNSDGTIKDKWNTCYLYPSVLFVEAMVDVLALIEGDRLPGVFDAELQTRIAITLFQACFRALLDQKSDGSWNQSIEETAYGILILSEARRIAFFGDLSQPLNEAIERGVAYVNSLSERPPNYIWIEKVSYASPLLTDSYLLAALKAASSTPGPTVGGSLWNHWSPDRLIKHVKLFYQAPLFNANPEWELYGSMIEAALFKPLVQARRLQVFPRTDVEDDDKYLDVIPFFWTSSNNRDRVYASTSFLYEMSLVALLNFQVDEFFEAVAGIRFKDRIDDLRALIHDLLPNDQSYVLSTVEDHKDDAAYVEVHTYLSKFLNYILGHPSVKTASAWDQRLLRHELRTYFLAHTQQAEDSLRFVDAGNGEKKPECKSIASTTFFKWVRTTSADHISCPYSFAFVSCLLGSTLTPRGGGSDCFPSAVEKYLATSLCRSLATMCRMFNDLGSVERDHDEGNLNSVDFPEFDSHYDFLKKKEALWTLGEYERALVRDALERLTKARAVAAAEIKDPETTRLGDRRMRIWTMFSEEVDLYGQVYVVQDISSRMNKIEGEQ